MNVSKLDYIFFDLHSTHILQGTVYFVFGKKLYDCIEQLIIGSSYWYYFLLKITFAPICLKM